MRDLKCLRKRGSDILPSICHCPPSFLALTTASVSSPKHLSDSSIIFVWKLRIETCEKKVRFDRDRGVIQDLLQLLVSTQS